LTLHTRTHTQDVIRSRDALLDLFRVFYFDQRFGRCQFADFRTNFKHLKLEYTKLRLDTLFKATFVQKVREAINHLID